MSSLDAAKKISGTAVRPQAALAVFAVTLFTSALLMFLLQPMFAKMALPRLGGTAAVWSLALVFFQTVLLLGYTYAHLLVKLASVRTGAIIHGLVMIGAMVSLPVSISAAWDIPPDSGQAFWLIGLFAASVGLPFFAISANAPLLQTWFSHSGHEQSKDPYFLYGASNIGSFAALFAYPLVVEPVFGLVPQSNLWSVGYVVLIVMVGTCGWIAASAAGSAQASSHEQVADAPVAWSSRLQWVLLAFVPSGLLVGTTAHMAMDLVSAPFMWVIPLALFLLTFVITFQTNPWIPHRFVMSRLGLIIAPLCLFALSPATNIWLLPLHLFVVFALMMACHGELVRLRPAAGRLTEFYLLMSFGGVLGGMFASLVAPVVFDSVIEYPLLIVGGFAVVGLVRGREELLSRRFLASLITIPAVIGLLWLTGDSAADAKNTIMLAWILFALGALLVLNGHALAQAVVLLTVMLVYQSVSKIPVPLEQSRSFYGVLSVVPDKDGQFHTLAHGTTRHGSQMRKDANGLRLTDNPLPQSYYYANGPFGSVIRHMRDGGRPLHDVAVVGLGTGAMLCHALPGEDWTFYEIDPEVVRIAENPEYFTYLRDCGVKANIVVGDGRLRMAQEPDAKFDLIVLDAFSSDSIPAHLMTVEALDIYRSKLKPDGVIVYHISNRFMELSGVVEAAARTRGLRVLYNSLDNAIWKPDASKLDMRPHLALVGKTDDALRNFAGDPAWHRAAVAKVPAAWTDDYSNVLDAIWRNFMGEQPY